MYNFLVRDPGKRVHSDASDALKSLAGAGVFGTWRNSRRGFLGSDFANVRENFPGKLRNVLPEILAAEKS